MSDLIIQIGFEEISFHHLKHLNIEKGTKLYKDGHIFNVKEKRKSGEITEITGHCIRQTSVTDCAYSLSFKIDDERKVISDTLFCTCKLGSDGCKHIAGLMIYINNDRQESKTDDSCEWIDPTTAGKKKYPKGLELEVIANIEQKQKCPPVPFKRPNDERLKRQIESMKACGNTSSPLYKACQLELQNSKTSTDVPKQEPTLPDWVQKEVFEPCLVQSNYKMDTLTQRERVYYEENVILSPKIAFKICCLTIGQGTTELWRKERKKRITGSKVCTFISIFKKYVPSLV